MDRIERNINNKKQGKISLVNSQPSLQTMRDGGESLHLGRDGILTRYRREKGILWKSQMTKDGNQIVEKDLKVNGNINLSNKLVIKNYPAFRVTATTNQALANGAYTTITFASSQYDNGSNFDLSNEYFVAPINGIYSLTAHILYEDSFSEHMDDNERLDIRIYNITDSSSVAISLHHFKFDFPDNRYFANTCNVETQLNAGDQIRVDSNNTTGNTINTYNGTQRLYSYFTGHLICAL
jgi:hypothetical protein